MLQINRRSFLIAVTGHDASRQAAWGAVRTVQLGEWERQVMAAGPSPATER